MTPAMLWPLAVVLVALFALIGWLRYLSRESVTALELRKTQEDWGKRFDAYERDFDALVKRVNAIQPQMQPLGKHYSTRSAG